MTSLVYCIVSVKLKIAALQGLHTLARAYDHSNWEDHLSSIVPQLLTELQVSCAGTSPFVFCLHFLMLPSILPSFLWFLSTLLSAPSPDFLQLGDESIQAHTLRLLRELLKNPLVHSSMAPFTASLTTAIIKAYSSSELNISQLAEDLFGVISSSLPSQTMVEQLGPLVAHETEATLLASIKLLTKVMWVCVKQGYHYINTNICPTITWND